MLFLHTYLLDAFNHNPLKDLPCSISNNFRTNLIVNLVNRKSSKTRTYLLFINYKPHIANILYLIIIYGRYGQSIL